MLADDEALNRQTLGILLEKAGYAVTLVDDGKPALEKIISSYDRRDPFDLLLTDMMMPEMSGIALIRELKKKNITIPVVAMTGYGDKDLIVELLRIGCSDYLEKPIKIGELLDHIQKIVKESNPVPALEYETNRYRTDDPETQIDAATKAYRNLVYLRDGGYNVHVAFYNRPLSALGGDFAGIANTPNGCDILVADVSGHDMGASFHTVLIDSFFKEDAHRADGGKAFFVSLNEKLLESGKEERMVTAIFLRLNLETMWGETFSAGHPPFVKQDPTASVFSPCDPKGDVLGVFNDADFESDSFPISHGDRLFLYTDGVTNAYRLDAEDGKIERLAVEGLKKLIEKNRAFPLKESVAQISKDILAFGGYTLKDDILLLGLEIP